MILTPTAYRPGTALKHAQANPSGVVCFERGGAVQAVAYEEFGVGRCVKAFTHGEYDTGAESERAFVRAAGGKGYTVQAGDIAQHSAGHSYLLTGLAAPLFADHEPQRRAGTGALHTFIASASVRMMTDTFFGERAHAAEYAAQSRAFGWGELVSSQPGSPEHAQGILAFYRVIRAYRSFSSNPQATHALLSAADSRARLLAIQTSVSPHEARLLARHHLTLDTRPEQVTVYHKLTSL